MLKKIKNNTIRKDDDEIWTYVLLEDKETKERWWQRIRPDLQIENHNGGRCPLSAKPELHIVDVCEAKGLEELNWNNTAYNNPSSKTGWLNRDGHFIGCPEYGHIFCASYVLGSSEIELEKKGWVKIASDPKLGKRYTFFYHFDHRLTDVQKRWLVDNGHKINPWDDD